MRPLEKKKAGETVVYYPSNRLADGGGVEYVIKQSYHPYGCAKNPLLANLGSYCSYCEERRAEGDLHVEHIASKGKGGAKEEWDNFLLSCNICNSVKGTKVLPENSKDMLSPHLDNTYLCFLYDESGRIRINPELTEDAQKLARILYDKIGLGRFPNAENIPTERDKRWNNRFESWRLATKCLECYKKKCFTKDDVLKFFQRVGNWSIFFTVFKGEDEVRKALIEEVPGTCATCFDANNHYNPITRNPGRDDLQKK